MTCLMRELGRRHVLFCILDDDIYEAHLFGHEKTNILQHLVQKKASA